MAAALLILSGAAMVLGPTLLYLHLPKTGGTWVASRLEAHGLGQHVSALGVRPHRPAAEIPRAWLGRRLVWATIRDPWSWYVSVVHHFMRPDGSLTGLIASRVGPEPRPFREILRGLLWPSGDLSRPVATFRRDGDAPVMREQVEYGEGFMSWLLRETCGSLPSAWVDLVAIRAGMSRLLGLAIEDSPRLNVSGPQEGHAPRAAHAPAVGYYDAESLEWVRRMDRGIVERFGFAGPDAPALRGVA